MQQRAQPPPPAPPPPHFGLGQPLPPGPGPASAIRGAAAQRQPSPFQTPDCTTRTLAFDSAASTATEDALQRARKRKRRIDEASAFITTRRRGRRTRGVDSEGGSEGNSESSSEGAPGHERSGDGGGEERDSSADERASMAAPMYSVGRRGPGPAADAVKAGGVVRSAAVSGLAENSSVFVNRGLDKQSPVVFAAGKLLSRPKATPGRKESLESHDAKAKATAKLRRLVRSCSARHNAVSALFFADKLIALSPRNPADVLLFADACFANQQYHRAIHAIKVARLVAINEHTGVHYSRDASVTLRASLLLGQCMLAIKQREECLELLSKVLPEREHDVVALARRIGEQANNSGVDPEEEDPDTIDRDGINLVASLALLMGETYEALGNRESATLYFRIALRCDVQCSEAFFHLFDKQMLSADEEKQLVASLDYSADEMGMLQSLYQINVGKYDTTPSVETKFVQVEDTLGLHRSLDVSVAKAEAYYYQHDVQRAHDICQRVRERDPFNLRVISVFVATLVELGKKRELYHYAHQMVDVYPKKASAWYTVGCYYLLVEKYDAAQRYFHKATTLEPTFAPAWIGLGNAFAAQDESDQAMSSYRTASSLFPGSHLPLLYIGMEYLRTNNLVQAQEYIRQAADICPTDPLIFNELGTVHYKQKEFPRAVEMFTKALELGKHVPERLMDAWEPTLFNLGYSYRKMRMFDEAIHCFQSALRLSPRNASILAALGFTFHMKGDLEQAIESYHAALAYNPEDSLAGTMITVAFEESLSSSHASFARMTASPARRPVHRNAPPSAGRGAVAGAGSRLGPVMEDSVLRRLDLDQSYSSIERSRQSLACSSLDFSDDSSMNMEED